MPGWYKQWTFALMRYQPAIDAEVEAERNNGFVAIVLGNMVVNVLYQGNAEVGVNAYVYVC